MAQVSVDGRAHVRRAAPAGGALKGLQRGPSRHEAFRAEGARADLLVARERGCSLRRLQRLRRVHAQRKVYLRVLLRELRGRSGRLLITRQCVFYGRLLGSVHFPKSLPLHAVILRQGLLHSVRKDPPLQPGALAFLLLVATLKRNVALLRACRNYNRFDLFLVFHIILSPLLNIYFFS